MRKRPVKKLSSTITSSDWLPIDRRLIPDIFAFRSVKGLARIFLIIEMVSATLVVLLTMVLALARIFV